MNIRNPEAPSPGDVLITSEHGTHCVSVVPNPNRVTFKEFRKAFQLAMRWTNDNRGDVWRKTDGIAVRILRARPNEKD